jgi:hypothetical protein
MLQQLGCKATPWRRGAAKGSPIKLILGAGAAAGAIGSVLALGTTVGGWLRDGSAGTVTKLRLQIVKPLTYGEWAMHEGVRLTGVSRARLRTPGRLITYQLDTQGYKDKTTLPGRIIVHDVTHHVSRSRAADVEVTAGENCGCADWIDVPRGRTRYYLEVEVFPPGAVHGEPLKTVGSPYFEGSSP